jgi:hypothetical protein
MNAAASPTMTRAAVLLRRTARAFAALPDVAFLLAIAAAYVAATLWLGRHLTFYLDECDFLARNLGDPMDWLRPHNEHWVTVAFPIYKTVNLLAGTESYAPYLLLLALTQIFMAAGLYRLLVPRSRSFAIFAFALLLFLGSGWENQFWAFQVGFVLATGFGVWALVAADRQRALATALLLLASAASSDIGLAFIPAAAIVIGHKRGLAWLAIPVAAFVAWYELFGRAAAGLNATILFTPERLVQIPGYVLASVNHAVAGVTGLGVVAAVLLLLLSLSGSSIAMWRGWRPSGLLTGAAIGIIVLFTIIGLGRASLPVLPPRYVTTAAVFLLGGAASVLPIHLTPRPRRLALAATLIFGVAALTSNVLAMQEGAHTQAYWDQTVYRCEPPR